MVQSKCHGYRLQVMVSEERKAIIFDLNAHYVLHKNSLSIRFRICILVSVLYYSTAKIFCGPHSGC